MSKKLIIPILERNYALDYLFFGKKASDLREVCCPELLKQYYTTKASLLLLMKEAYSKFPELLIKTNRKINNSKALYESSKSLASYSKIKTKNFLSSPTSKKMLTEAVMKKISSKGRKNKVSNIVYEMVEDIGLKFAVDQMLTNNSVDLRWRKSVLREAYNILRNSLVSIASIIRNS